MPEKPSFLLVNDDGIVAPGLQALADALSGLGSLTIVAPEKERSATGHAITLHDVIYPRKYYKNGKFFGIAISGMPADCSKFALHKLMKKLPDLVISGINLGSNTGYNVLYSGTVAAAAEGTIMGIPSLAVSLTTYVDPHFEPAQIFIRHVVEKILEKGLPKGVLLNINVPNVCSLSDIQGVEITRQGSAQWREIFVERINPKQEPYYWLSGEKVAGTEAAETDEAAILEQKISITPLKFDLTDIKALSSLKSYGFNLYSEEARDKTVS
ncbi:MAG: 5'/3'-nucleotidase SurE [Candidatus Marinimicrobia bacterium]|nr:5'/3'-nucleotidase SurE [Candidatus Neomarinimicrobiota bacterium]MDD5582197.1 5'/3'-nucleotidase SurE [Candidatus Neomarinimicrobiota bacterium]